MSGNIKESQPLYPSISSSPATELENPFYQTIPESLPSTSEQAQNNSNQYAAAAAASSSSLPPSHDERTEKWGTHVMGTPAIPTSHPDNKKAALWAANDEDAHCFHHPYLQYTPIEKSTNSTTTKESVLRAFNSFGNKAEAMAHNIWHNLRTNSSVRGAAWGKMHLTAKAIIGVGFEALYKQTFTGTHPNEKLKKTFACYLSTTTGPVAGTLYLSDAHAAFCSDRPLSFTTPSGQEAWSYYKVMIPLSKIGTVNPVVMRESKAERYIQVVAIDGHDFWFMGFVNYEKASRHLTESISNFQ